MVVVVESVVVEKGLDILVVLEDWEVEGSVVVDSVVVMVVKDSGVEGLLVVEA